MAQDDLTEAVSDAPSHRTGRLEFVFVNLSVIYVLLCVLTLVAIPRVGFDQDDSLLFVPLPIGLFDQLGVRLALLLNRVWMFVVLHLLASYEDPEITGPSSRRWFLPFLLFLLIPFADALGVFVLGSRVCPRNAWVGRWIAIYVIVAGTATVFHDIGLLGLAASLAIDNDRSVASAVIFASYMLLLTGITITAFALFQISRTLRDRSGYDLLEDPEATPGLWRTETR